MDRTWPEQSIVWPERTSDIVTLFFAPVNEILNGVKEDATETAIDHCPSAPTVHGLDGATVAPAGRPETRIASPGTPTPNIAAGVTPALHASELAITMWLANTQELGPHAFAYGQVHAEVDAAIASKRAARRIVP